MMDKATVRRYFQFGGIIFFGVVLTVSIAMAAGL